MLMLSNSVTSIQWLYQKHRQEIKKATDKELIEEYTNMHAELSSAAIIPFHWEQNTSNRNQKLPLLCIIVEHCGFFYFLFFSYLLLDKALVGTSKFKNSAKMIQVCSGLSL